MSRTIDEIKCDYVRLANDLKLSAEYMMRRLDDINGLAKELSKDHMDKVEDMCMWCDTNYDITNAESALEQLESKLRGW